MKTIVILSLVAATSVTFAGARMEPSRPAPRNPAPPVFVAPHPYETPRPARVQQQWSYEQQAIAAAPALISPEQAQQAVDRFRDRYATLGSPRIAIYVNRDLIDQSSGMRLGGHTLRTETRRSEVDSDFQRDANSAGGSPPNTRINAGGNVTVQSGGFDPAGRGTIRTRTDREVAETKFQNQAREETLADRQTVRDVERLFGRPLRAGGAALADQRLASQLIADRPLNEILRQPAAGSEAARKDREALANIADVVLEILLSSRNITVNEVSGARTYVVPDIQATAIRLSDSRIIGQASASDVLGADRLAGPAARAFSVQEIAEATALALMEDIASGRE